MVRHGLSEGNVDPAVYGEKPDAHIALVEEGWEQARQAGRRIRAIVGDGEAVQFVTSSYRRTRETLDGILMGGGFIQQGDEFPYAASGTAAAEVAWPGTVVLAVAVAVAVAV